MKTKFKDVEVVKSSSTKSLFRFRVKIKMALTSLVESSQFSFNLISETENLVWTLAFYFLFIGEYFTIFILSCPSF